MQAAGGVCRRPDQGSPAVERATSDTCTTGEHTSPEIIFEVSKDAVDGGYTASAPGYGIHAQGGSIEEVRASVKETVNRYLKNAMPLTRPKFITGRQHAHGEQGRGGKPENRNRETTEMTNWDMCPAVERTPGKVSGVWVFAGTRIPLSALYENLAGGATVHEFVEWFPGVDDEQVRAVLEHEARSLKAAAAR